MYLVIGLDGSRCLSSPKVSRWCPPSDVCWFINHRQYRYNPLINPSYGMLWDLKANLANELGHHRQGEIHFYSEVCGLTYFLLPLRRHRTHWDVFFFVNVFEFVLGVGVSGSGQAGFTENFCFYLLYLCVSICCWCQPVSITVPFCICCWC